MIYALIKQFEKHHRALKLLDNNGYHQLQEDFERLKKQGVELPEYMDKVFHEMFE